MRLYALLIPMLYCDAITDAMTKGLGQQKACVRYNIITSAMDVILLFILLPRYGMIGYFFSFLITHLLNFILSLRKLLQITGPVLPIKTPLMALIAAVCSIWICSHIHHSVAGAILFLPTFICALSLMGLFGKDDLLWLKGLLAKK